MSESSISSHSSSEKVELSIHIDSELLDQIKHLTNDPSKVIETAIKQWLRGERREDDQAMSLRRNPPIPPRGEWNDWVSLARDSARKSAGCEIRSRPPKIRLREPADFAAKARGCSELAPANSQPRNFSFLWSKKSAIQSPAWFVRTLKFWRNFPTISLIRARY